MPYIIETFDKPGSLPLRQKHRSNHLVFLEKNKSLLIACGAKLHDNGEDLGGGIYIVDLDSREATLSFIEADPFFIAGLFSEIKITNWRKAYVGGECKL